MHFNKNNWISKFGSAIKSENGIAENANPKNFPMSFDFIDDYPKSVFSDLGDRLIGKSGSGNMYSIKAHPEWNFGSKNAPAMKGHLVNMVLSEPESYYKIGDPAAISSASRIISERFGLSPDSITSKAVALDTFGYGPISILLEDAKNIEEIVVNGINSRIAIYHTKFGFCNTNMKFVDEDSARHTINKLLEPSDKELASETPIIDSGSEYGLRIHAQQPPYSSSGIIASIRIAKQERAGISFLLRKATLNPELLAYIWMAIEAKLNILITGSPSSGKTTLLKALMEVAPKYERAVIIEEEASELISYSNFSNAVYLVGKNTNANSGYKLQDQVINALRLRPDRLIIGEIRGPEAKDAFFGSNTGVPFIATMHASGSGLSIIARLESKPMNVDHALVSNLDIAIALSFDQSLNRAISSISEYKWLSRAETGDDAKEFTINELFMGGKPTKEQLRGSKVIVYFAMRNLISITEAIKSFEKRVKFINSFLNSNEQEFEDYKIKYWGS